MLAKQIRRGEGSMHEQLQSDDWAVTMDQAAEIPVRRPGDGGAGSAARRLNLPVSECVQMGA